MNWSTDWPWHFLLPMIKDVLCKSLDSLSDIKYLEEERNTAENKHANGSHPRRLCSLNGIKSDFCNSYDATE